MITYFAYRYVVPPFLCAMLVALAAVFSATPILLPGWVTELLGFDNAVTAVATLLAAGVVILGFGFVIATIPVFVLRIVAVITHKPRGLSVHWTEGERKRLCTIYAIGDFNREAEPAEHVLLSETASEHVMTWMVGRWEYYLININCACSTILAMAFVPLLGIRATWWWLAVSILLLMFLVNGIQARWEVNEMDHLLLRNYEKLKVARK